ncbi:DUF3298 and DUF4163 domain-containing protein [Pontibacter mangrovi]|uniref:DUF3298 and DUF4163 domain-containing protein n=1 Tax=Pontibacter mangrovi TaxID=2589816 RepID=A0A501W9X4_9BACT|nr:DUF3298 and DUF4163 domain-containing protein [Pontibacter mangrovi]TPE46188.1 DUF3298 and DUF4163 domain-containing protein [Pontibacter mangrovi]
MPKRLIYTCLITTAILYSCQSGSTEEATTAPEAMQQAEVQPLSFRSQTVSRRSSYCGQSPEACAEATITYLEAFGGSEELRQRINKFLEQNIMRLLLDYNPDADTSAVGKKAAVTVAEAFVKAQEDFVREMDEIPASAAWELQLEVQPLFQSDSVTTILSSYYAYAGGAHPNSYISLQSFEMEGKKLRPADIVTDTLQLKQMVEQEFRRVREIPTGQHLSEAGLFLEDNQLPLPQEMGLTAQGLSLYYNAYEIGPYAFGATDLLLPYPQLHGLLRSKYRPR